MGDTAKGQISAVSQISKHYPLAHQSRKAGVGHFSKCIAILPICYLSIMFKSYLAMTLTRPVFVETSFVKVYVRIIAAHSETKLWPLVVLSEPSLGSG